MISSDTFIVFLLSVIAYFLYQIAKQLSYLTGKRLKFSLFKWQIPKRLPKIQTKREEPRLPN